MKKLFMKKFLCLCGLALVFTGCYREEIDSLKSEVDDLRINDLETMVSNMGSSVKDLMALKDVLDPAVKDLQSQKEEILKEISAMQGKMGEDEKASTEMQAQLLSLQTQLTTINAALDAINQANLGGRIDDLKAFVNAANNDIKGRIDALDVLQQTFATADALAALQKAFELLQGDVKKIQDDFDAEFLEALDRNKTEIISWISSESETIKNSFKDYYTKSQVDALLDMLRATDVAQDSEIKSLQSQVNDLDTALRKLIEDEIAGSEKKLAQRIDSIEQTLAALTERVNGLEQRIVALEELYDVIGDYKHFQGNLIDAIKALQTASDDRQKETDNLSSLLNTLKLILTNGEGNYYDLAQIVADIASNTGSAADHEKRLAYLEDLVGSLADVETLNGLDGQVAELRDMLETLDWNIYDNASDIAALVKKVDAIVAKWSDEVFSQIKSNTEELAKLKEQDIALQAAIDKAISDGKDADQKEHDEVLGLIAKINESIAGLITRADLAEKGITDANEAIEKVNELLSACQIDIKGLQESLSGLDTRISKLTDEIARIWAVIGTEELSIKGSLINAINVINAKFGDLGGKTVKELLDALNADLAIINAAIEGINGTIDDIKGGETTESLTSLKKLIDGLTTIAGGKADAKAVEDLKTTVTEIQKDLKDFMDKYNDALGDYLLKEEAKNTYATIVAVNKYIDLYTKLVGELEVKAETILGEVAALNLRLTTDEGTITGYNTEIGKINEAIGKIEGDVVTVFSRIGNGKFTNDWTTDLTAAVNKLHELVGDKSVSEQATEIAQQQANTIAAGMVDDLIKAILGKEGTGADIKALLDGFAASVSTLEGRIKELGDMIGDLSELQKEDGNPDIAHMISNIKAVLAQLDATYAAKQHTHVQADIEGLLDALKTINDNIAAVSDKLDTLDTYVRVTLVDIINDLDAKFEGYTTPDAVKALIAEAESVLAAAILGDKEKGGEYFTKYFSELNLNALSDRIQDILATDINDIIKPGGTIDTKAQALIDAAIKELKIDEYLKIADFDEKIVKILGDYATNESVKDAKAIAATFAALKIVLGEKEYTYDKFNEAVQDVYNELQSKYSALQQEIAKHIGDYNTAKEAFDNFKGEYEAFLAESFKDVKDRLDLIYPLIGDGFKDKTITAVINEILEDIIGINTLIEGVQEDLAEVIGAQKEDSELISGLQDVQESLVAALFGGTIPESGIPDGGYAADFEKRIAALEKTLSEIGFDTIKNKEGKNLSTVISEINGQISDLGDTIGEGYDKDHTVADALAAFKEALEGFVKGTVYEEKVGGIEAGLQDLIDALTGAAEGEGAISNVKNLSDLATTLSGLVSRLDKFKGTEQDIEAFVSELQTKISSIEGIVGDVSILGEDFVSLAQTIKELHDYIYSEEFSGKVYDNAAEALKARMGVTELLNMIGNLNELKTKARGDLVSAINEIYSALNGGTFITKEDLDKLKLQILFGTDTEGEYSTLKALEDAIKLFISEVLGSKPDGFDDASVFAAIERLEELISSLGENTDGSSIWGAIADLKALAESISGAGEKTLSDYLHSMSFISDYADGKATLPCDRSQTEFRNLVMKFIVTASSQFDIKNYSVKALVRGVNTRADGEEESVECSAEYSNGILTVTAPGKDVYDAMSGKDAAFVAVVIEQNDGGTVDKFTSQYVPVYLTNSYIEFGSLPADYKITKTGDNLTLYYASQRTYSNMFETSGSSFTITPDGNYGWITIDPETLEIEVKENTGDERTAKFTISGNDAPASLTFTIKQPKKRLIATMNNVEGTSFQVRYSTSCSIKISNNFEFNGSYSLSGTSGNYNTKPKITSNNVTFTTASRSNWSGGKFTVSTQNPIVSLTVTLTSN